MNNKNLHTIAKKVTAVVVAFCIASGTCACGIPQMKGESEIISMEDGEISISPKAAEMNDSDFETMIAGNSTEDQLDYVLAYGPLEIPEQGFEGRDYYMILNSLCNGINLRGRFRLEDYGQDEEGRNQYSLNDVNRLFRSFTDYQLAEGDGVLDGLYNVKIQGDIVTFPGSSIDRVAYAEIIAAAYTEERMEICYIYTYYIGTIDGPPPEENMAIKKAVLKPNADGLYQIVEIQVIYNEQEVKEEMAKRSEA